MKSWKRKALYGENTGSQSEPLTWYQDFSSHFPSLPLFNSCFRKKHHSLFEFDISICFPHLRLIRAKQSYHRFPLQKHTHSHTIQHQFSFSPSLQWHEPITRFCPTIIHSSPSIHGHLTPSSSPTSTSLITPAISFLPQITCIYSRTPRPPLSRAFPPRR